jgi:hypothetical protein
MDSPTPIEAAPGITSRIVGAGWGVLARLSPFGGEATEEALWKSVKGKEFVYLPNVKVCLCSVLVLCTRAPDLRSPSHSALLTPDRRNCL